MIHRMPIYGFEWMTAAEAREIDWQAQTEDQPVGYFIEASIHYLVELHEAHNDYPLAPERLDVQVKMLSGNQGATNQTYMPSSQLLTLPSDHTDDYSSLFIYPDGFGSMLPSLGSIAGANISTASDLNMLVRTRTGSGVREWRSKRR